ncbi:MAG: oligoendopeptidase F, partial [Pseudomonadota bacterium]
MTNAPSTIDPSTLPTWNLADLYSGPDAAELMADLDRIKTDADAFRERFQGRLVSAAPSELSAAITAYEALGDLMGRIGSFAFLHYVGDQQDAARTKLFGD